MHSNTCRQLIAVLGLLAAFLVGFAPAQAGYIPPSSSGSLTSAFSTFLTDFSQWNQSENNQPLLLLEMTPAQNRGQVALWLFWQWLQTPHGEASSGSAPPGPGSSVDLSFGTIPSGPTGQGLSLPPLSGGDDLPVLGGTLGYGPLLGGPLPPRGNPENGHGPYDPPVDPPAAPEPPSLALLGTGAVTLLTYRWHGRRTRGQNPSEPAE